MWREEKMRKDLLMSEMIINALRADGFRPKSSHYEAGHQIEPAILLHNTDGTYQVRRKAGHGIVMVVVMEVSL